MKYAKKRQLTQSKIKSAYINLLQNAPQENITINMIAKKAEISRSSFYRYYFDKYELINEIENDVLKAIQSFKKYNKPQNETFFDKDSNQQIEKLLLFMSNYSREINGLLNQSLDLSFESKLREKLTHRLYILTRLPESSIKMNLKKQQEFQLIVEYMVSMIIQTFKFWSNPDCQMNAHELSTLLNDIKNNGFSKIISLLNNQPLKL
ncbi:TetR/AcrR family transcriptional regulator [Lactiplantibacillus plantarum]|nr:TetR/AcrR family transcriptional regulator [Lactiplantibacillus plantarum]